MDNNKTFVWVFKIDTTYHDWAYSHEVMREIQTEWTEATMQVLGDDDTAAKERFGELTKKRFGSIEDRNKEVVAEKFEVGADTPMARINRDFNGNISIMWLGDGYDD